MMRLPKVSLTQLTLGALGALVLFGSGPAMGHSLLVVPPPRDQQDGYKDPPRNVPGSTGAPCGIGRSVPAQPQTTFSPGQPLHVQWSETINHPGCFVIDFASANDTDFQVLGVKSHSTAAGGMPRPWSLDVVLPSAPCSACTLRLRQLMLAADLPDAQCPPATIPVGSTYYSCSNVTLGAGDGGVSDARPDSGGTVAAGGTSGGGGRAGAGGRTGATGSGGAAPASATGGAPGGVSSSGGATTVETGTGGGVATGTTGSGGAGTASGGSGPASSPGTGGGVTGGGVAAPAGTASSSGGCSMLGAPSTPTLISLVSALCLAGVFIVRRRRPSTPRKRND